MSKYAKKMGRRDFANFTNRQKKRIQIIFLNFGCFRSSYIWQHMSLSNNFQKFLIQLHVLLSFPAVIFFYKKQCVCVCVSQHVHVFVCDLALSALVFRQSAGDISPGYAALGEAHLRNLYREDAGGELYCLYLQTVRVSFWEMLTLIWKKDR